VGVTVRFAVTGVHSGSGAVETDGSGQAAFCYAGSQPGSDTITAFTDTNKAGTQDPGEPGDAATNSWTAP
jgi:hypothetical protein